MPDAMSIPVLDKGYVKLVESWGSDERIIEAARMSTNGGFVSWEPYEGHPKGDAGLLRYLWTNKHLTPFEMAGATFEIYAPIFVIREWHRHRTFSYNEMSGRYTELPDDYYIPTIERIMGSKQSRTNKQGSEVGIDEGTAHLLWENMREAVLESRRAYEHLLADGVAREVARMVLPVSQYSRFRASGNLRNWLHFLGLRLDKGAQWEIREYARIVSELISTLFQRTWELFARDLSR